MIGGGLSGSSAAFSLARSGKAWVTVFDQGRAPGGRCSSRRYEELDFDHGLQFIRKEEEPCMVVDELVRDSVLRPWMPKLFSLGEKTATRQWGFFDVLKPRGSLFVGSPSSSAICAHLLKRDRINLKSSTRVDSVSLSDNGTWTVEGEEFDALIVSDMLAASPRSPSYIKAEGEQANEVMSRFYEAGGGFQGHTIFSLMLLTDQPLPFDAASVTARHISFIVDESSKPGRSLATSDGKRPITVITNEQFGATLSGRDGDGKLPPQSPAYLEERCRLIMQGLKDDLKSFDIQVKEPSFFKCHRWGSAYPRSRPESIDLCSMNITGRFAVASDFLEGKGAASAIKSGQMAAKSILES